VGALHERDSIELFEFLPEVLFKRGPITNIGAIIVFEIAQPRDQIFFKIALCLAHCRQNTHWLKNSSIWTNHAI
jgi:hypothetical protein